MSRIRRVGGNIIKRTKGDHIMYSGGSIITTSNGKIIEHGEEGITYGEPEEYEWPPTPINAKCIIHFRPNANWQGEYGFDWMRVGDTELKGDNPYQDIIIEKEVTEKDKELTAYERLKRVYGDRFTDRAHYIPWRTHKDEKTGEEVTEDYFAPWLVLFPEQIKDKQSGEWVDSGYANTQAELSLVVEVEEDADGYAFKYDDSLLEASYDEIPATKGNYKNIRFTVKCLREFSETENIRIYSIDKGVAKIKKLAGVLRIMPNAIVYKPKVVLVRVTTRIGLINKVGIPSNDAESIIKKHLRQALIEPQIEWANLEVLAQQFYDHSINQTVSRSDCFKRRNTIESMIKVNSGNIHGDLEVFLQSDAINNRKDYSKHFKVYYINEDPNVEELLGISTEDENARTAIIFPKGFDDDTVSHELLHAMGLNHPSDPRNLHVFKKHHTDNIMDYEQTKALMPGMSFKQIPCIQLWKWQIDYIREGFVNDYFKMKL